MSKKVVAVVLASFGVTVGLVLLLAHVLAAGRLTERDCIRGAHPPIRLSVCRDVQP